MLFNAWPVLLISREVKSFYMIVFQCHKLLLRIFLNVITTVLLFIFTYFLFCAIPSMYMGMQINCCCCCCCCIEEFYSLQHFLGETKQMINCELKCSPNGVVIITDGYPDVVQKSIL